MVQTGLNSRGGCESRLLEREVVLLWRHLLGGEEPAVRAQKIVPIVTVQNHYNLADRQSERMDEAQSEQMIDKAPTSCTSRLPRARVHYTLMLFPTGAIYRGTPKHD